MGEIKHLSQEKHKLNGKNTKKLRQTILEHNKENQCWGRTKTKRGRDKEFCSRNARRMAERIQFAWDSTSGVI